MEKTRPEFEAKYGTIRVACFPNRTKEGRVWYSSAPSRRYYTEEGNGKANYSSTFTGVGDLVLLREAIDDTIAWLKGRAEESVNDSEEVAED